VKDISLTRRSLLQSASFAASAATGQSPAALVESTAAASLVALPAPEVLPVSDTFRTHLQLALHSIARRASFDDRLPPGQERLIFGNFSSMALSAGDMLLADPADRLQAAASEDAQWLFESDDRRITDPSLVADDKKLVALLEEEWALVKSVAHLLPPDSRGPRDIDEIHNWPNRNAPSSFMDMLKGIKPPQAPPPRWWHGLSEKERVHVWIEADYASFHHRPLGYFFTGERMADILKDNLPRGTSIDAARFPTGFYKQPFHHYLTYCGPKKAPDVYRKHRTLIYRAEGLPLKLAERKAWGDYLQEEHPPALSITRYDFVSLPGQSIYRMQATSAPDAETGFRRLFIAHQFMSNMLTALAPEDGSRLQWKGTSIWVSANGPRARELMENASLNCFTMDEAWFKREPTQLEATIYRPTTEPPVRASFEHFWCYPHDKEGRHLAAFWKNAGFHL
jgi:hypothetical protein